MSTNRVFGIDLGTTYSCIAYVDEHGKPVIVQNSEGESTTPSVVYFESAENVVVGQAAKEVVAIHTEQCVATVKRVMGDPHWEQVILGQTYRPQDISSFILRKVVSDAANITGQEIKDVVITCPAYFGVNEKEATKQAGVLAGLNVLYVIPEPTAAALAYGIEQTEDQVILVYDLGGGTFDITMIHVTGQEITVICTGGDHQLGGKNWDDAIVTYLAQEFAKSTGTSAETLLDDQESYQELLIAAERCKKTLSTRQTATEVVRFGGERVKVDLTRATFDKITESLLENTLSLTDQEIAKAKGKGFSKIDKLLLVGGSTYMPQVIDTVKKRYPFEVRQFDPNQAVAKGAAIFGFKCFLEEKIKSWLLERTGQADPVNASAATVAQAQAEVANEIGLSLPGLKALVERTVTNVTSKSFGIVVMNKDGREVVTNLIEVDDAVPKSVSRTFGVYEDGQVQVDLRCMENTLHGLPEIEIQDCREIGQQVITSDTPLKRGSPVEITFQLGADGRLSITGRETTTGREVTGEFVTGGIMSKKEEAVSKSRNLNMDVS